MLAADGSAALCVEARIANRSKASLACLNWNLAVSDRLGRLVFGVPQQVEEAEIAPRGSAHIERWISLPPGVASAVRSRKGPLHARLSLVGFRREHHQLDRIGVPSRTAQTVGLDATVSSRFIGRQISATLRRRSFPSDRTSDLEYCFVAKCLAACSIEAGIAMEDASQIAFDHAAVRANAVSGSWMILEGCSRTYRDSVLRTGSIMPWVSILYPAIVVNCRTRVQKKSVSD